MESWRFVTATELASEPKPAGESSAVAHSHCEPRPFLYVPNIKGVKILKGHYLPVSMSHKKGCMHVCMYQLGALFSPKPLSNLSNQNEPQAC